MRARLVLMVAVLAVMAGCSVFKGGKGKEEVVTITTDLGTIDLVLFNKTPLHKTNFLKLTRQGYYDGTTFHRVIKGFMIQGGDPNSKDADASNDGNGGPGYTVPAEFDAALTHNQGAVAAARLGDGQNPKKESSGSQFYIVEGKEGSHFLDQNYTVFGQVVRGNDIVSRIAEQRKNPSDRPLTDLKMKVTVRRMSRKQIEKDLGYTFPAGL